MSVQDKAIIVRSSPFSHAETVRRLTLELHERGIRLFATVDHAANARTVGMEMPRTTVLIFGNPAVGTPAMLAAPDLALELPSRVLVRENADETVSVVYADPVRIGERYGLSADLVQGLSGLARVIEAALRTGDLHRVTCGPSAGESPVRHDSPDGVGTLVGHGRAGQGRPGRPRRPAGPQLGITARPATRLQRRQRSLCHVALGSGHRHAQAVPPLPPRNLPAYPRRPERSNAMTDKQPVPDAIMQLVVGIK